MLMTQRYIHPQAQAIERAFVQMANRHEVFTDGGQCEKPIAESEAGCEGPARSKAKGLVGAPGVARTPDLQIRSLPLYPSELQARALKQMSCSDWKRFFFQLASIRVR